MAKEIFKRERLSIDVFPREHRQIKILAALHNKTIREYVLESIKERLKRETEIKELSALTAQLDKDPVLKKLWDNQKDSAYDKL